MFIELLKWIVGIGAIILVSGIALVIVALILVFVWHIMRSIFRSAL